MSSSCGKTKAATEKPETQGTIRYSRTNSSLDDRLLPHRQRPSWVVISPSSRRGQLTRQDNTPSPPPTPPPMADSTSIEQKAGKHAGNGQKRGELSSSSKGNPYKGSPHEMTHLRNTRHEHPMAFFDRTHHVEYGRQFASAQNQKCICQLARNPGRCKSPGKQLYQSGSRMLG